MNKDGDLKQTLKEVKHLLLAWLFFASWVLIYCGFEAYSQDHEDVKITLGCHHGFFGESPYRGFVQ